MAPETARKAAGRGPRRRDLQGASWRAGLECRRDAPGALPLVATLCEAGRTGRAAGAGIHDWPGDGGPPVASAEVARRIAELRRAAGMPPRSFSREDLEGALLSALAKAGAALLADGIAVRPADIDLVAVHGLGMARVTGGPMTAADLRGLDALRDRLKSLERLDRDIWGREPLIDRLAAAGEGFADFRR